MLDDINKDDANDDTINDMLNSNSHSWADVEQFLLEQQHSTNPSLNPVSGAGNLALAQCSSDLQNSVTSFNVVT